MNQRRRCGLTDRLHVLSQLSLSQILERIGDIEFIDLAPEGQQLVPGARCLGV